MTLEELAKEIAVTEPKVEAVSVVNLTPHRDPGAVLRFPHQKRRDSPEYRPSRLLPGGHVVIVENDDGMIEYKVLYSDGHLGAVEDF